MIDTLTPVELSEEGKQAFKKGNYQDAAALFDASARGYSQGGDTVSAAENDNNRCVALMRAGDLERALEAVQGTPAVFQEAGDLRRKGMALGNQGAVLQKLGDIEGAVVAFEEGAEIFKQLGEHDLRAPLLEALSVVQFKTGRKFEAAATYNSGLGEYEKPALSKRIMKKLVGLPIRHIFKI